MTQLIASYELAIGCENTASIIPFTRPGAGFFLLGEPMSEITFIVPNDWVTEDKLVEITGLRPGTIEAARKKSWMVGREYIHISPDGVPKKNSECMYNRKAVDQWVESLRKNQPGARQ